MAKQLEDQDESLKKLTESYSESAKKNQEVDFKKRPKFLKIFSLFFAVNLPDFYDGPEVNAHKKTLADLDIKLNTFELSKTTQACFWYMFFKFMTPINPTFEINTTKRKLLDGKYGHKANSESRPARYVFTTGKEGAFGKTV